MRRESNDSLWIGIYNINLSDGRMNEHQITICFGLCFVNLN